MHAHETPTLLAPSLPRILDVACDVVADLLTIHTPRLQLQAIERVDGEAVALLAAADDAPAWLQVPFAVMVAATEEGSRVCFLMRCHATGAVVGMVAVVSARNQCSLDCYVAPAHLRRGYAREAVNALARVALGS